MELAAAVAAVAASEEAVWVWALHRDDSLAVLAVVAKAAVVQGADERDRRNFGDAVVAAAEVGLSNGEVA